MTHAFDWTARLHDSQRLPVFARNVVATSQPLAAQAGLRILANGGNAVDAAIAATAAAMTIVEPVSNGLGSDAFCACLWDGKKLARGLPERLGPAHRRPERPTTSAASTAPPRGQPAGARLGQRATVPGCRGRAGWR